MHDYLDRVIDVLVTAGSTAIEERAVRRMSGTLVDLRAAIRFYDRSYLSVWMRVRISRSNLSLQRYAFHYMTADSTTIFRNDNSDYHPGGEYAPHHKHIGADERLIDCPQPTIRQIRDEIAAHLNRKSCK